jgi:hypothetical protein
VAGTGAYPNNLLKNTRGDVFQQFYFSAAKLRAKLFVEAQNNDLRRCFDIASMLVVQPVE